MLFKNTILFVLLRATSLSLCAPVDDKLDVKVEIQINSGNDDVFNPRSQSLHAPRLGRTPVVDHGSYVASKPIQTTDVIVTLESSFTLQIDSFPVGATSEGSFSEWFPFSILNTGSPTVNFTLVDGVLTQDDGVVMRYIREDISLLPKRIYINRSQRDLDRPTRWRVFGYGDRRTLSYLEGGDGKHRGPKARRFMSANFRCQGKFWPLRRLQVV